MPSTRPPADRPSTSLRASRRAVAPFVAMFAVLMSAAATAAGADALAERVSTLVAKYEKASRGVVGVCVIDIRTARPLVNIRADAPRVPASNQKLLTGAFALARLGGGFRFTTAVCLHDGDLLVVGDGDPTLGDPELARAAGRTIYDELDGWSIAIRERLGRQFAGDLLVCGNPNTAIYRHSDWPAAQHRGWYSAPVSGLNIHNNCLDVTFRLADGTPVPAVEPASEWISIVNRLRPGRRHLWRLELNTDDSVATLRGTVSRASGDPISVAIDDPPMLLGRVLADRLRREGVHFTGSVRVLPPAKIDLAGTEVVYTTRTSLSVAMSRANKRSLNMAAECIFLRAGDGTWAGSAEAMAETLVGSYGLSRRGLVVRDGSGLSKGNRISPAGLAALLAEVLKRRDADVLVRSLPISGTDGSLSRRLRREPYRGRVLAKTGYVAGACCLSGYVLDANATPAMTFSILANDFSGGAAPAKRLQDAICRLLVDHLRRHEPATIPE